MTIYAFVLYSIKGLIPRKTGRKSSLFSQRIQPWNARVPPDVSKFIASYYTVIYSTKWWKTILSVLQVCNSIFVIKTRKNKAQNNDGNWQVKCSKCMHGVPLLSMYEQLQKYLFYLFGQSTNKIQHYSKQYGEGMAAAVGGRSSGSQRQ